MSFLVFVSFLQEQLRFNNRPSLLEFLERDVGATLSAAKHGEEAFLDTKATRAAWAR